MKIIDTLKELFVSDDIKIHNSRAVSGGVQVFFKFNNGYGASVIKTQYSYGGKRGLWELAVVQYNGLVDNEGFDEFEIVYDTPITSGVIGYLNEKELFAELLKIRNLK